MKDKNHTGEYGQDRDLRCGSQSFVQVLHRTKPTVWIIVHFKAVHVALLRQLYE
jgi:hypothetical protein